MDRMSLVLQDGEAARALRYCAQTITTRVRELQRVSRGTASETVTRQQQQEQQEDDDEVEEGPAATSAGGFIVDGIDNDTSSPEKWLEKLADTRRKWMVTVHRYSSSMRDDSEWRDEERGGVLQGWTLDSAADKGGGRHAVAPPAAVASGRLATTNNDRDHHHFPRHSRHDHHQVTIVPAAGFCPRCSSVVQVAFEFTAQGKLLAEHHGRCAPCEEINALYGQARHVSRSLDMRSLPRRPKHQASGV